MRADRLVAVLLLLQSRGRVTAAEVAEELEVSVATARRDLEALAMAGIPVYPQAGRGGGWSLLGGARTDLSGLTSGEAEALFSLVGPAAGLVPEARSALRKLVRALPGTFREAAEAAATAVVVDADRWGEAGADGEARRPALVGTLQRAVVRRRRVELDYARPGRPPTTRLVDPWGLVDKGEHWYLVAGTEAGQRTFRLDRVTRAEVTDQPAERPADFALADAWERVVDAVEAVRGGVWATVLVPARFVDIVRDHFGRHCVVEGPVDDDWPGGRVRARVAADHALSIAEKLAGWGHTIEVVEPEAVREELARLGSELVGRYGPGAPPPSDPPLVSPPAPRT
jgi:predicted DNA-binding transcriptional regulator YafY